MVISQLYRILVCTYIRQYQYDQQKRHQVSFGELSMRFMARKVIVRQVPPEHLQRMKIREARARREDHEFRQLRGWNNKWPVLKTEVADFVTSLNILVEMHEGIAAAAAAAAESNLHR